MTIFKKVLYTDGGPNDKGTVIGYTSILAGETEPTNENGFERWEKISMSEYEKDKKEAHDKYKLFII
jgi:hypothetical protein